MFKMNNKMSFSLRKFTQAFLHIIQRIASALLPSYIQLILRNEPSKPTKASPTSYLNGFRGTMAFLVFVRHFSLPWQSDLDYGLGQGENHTGIFRLPILRIIYAGPYVPIFLIISGYVMSLKPLRLLNMDQKEAFLASMISSLFRRAIRIFPPPILSSFLFMLAVHFELFKFQYNTMDGFIPHHPDRLSTFFDQFIDWLQFVFGDLTNLWDWKMPKSVYGGHLWTIGLQFRCSMVVFLALIGLANTRKHARQTILALLFVYCMFSGRWDVALYLSGIFMAGTEAGIKDISAHTVIPSLDLEKGSLSSAAVRFRSRISWCVILLAGLYLSSYPRARDGIGAPGYRVLYDINPSYFYWQGNGAIFLIWSLISSKTAQGLFNYSFPQYLGDISFSLYIVHEPLLHVLGYRMVNFAWRITGKEQVLQYQLGFFMALLLMSPILLLTADIFHRIVDEPCADLGRWLETKCK
ncbi:hypothetical protein OIDMADRAFT_170325 [Oidiodendron maius Zn]|uniref:Acyltransferase 3 domain-containing protein n=1 Tax=Oidiodendron maius (strain Zn) TaxID=913774 RepID=A0A0C3CCG3_OIDMZ|nr:hypothetical protein OIDMADRAFT_170325 [Oidiodendron maius Zn]